jgi:hypothetical protein
VSRSRRFEDPVTSIAREEPVSVRGLTRSAVSWDPTHPIRDRVLLSRPPPIPLVPFLGVLKSPQSASSTTGADAAKEREPLGIDHET